jgi:glycerophosphoryl diester phosphodiesterase
MKFIKKILAIVFVFSILSLFSQTKTGNIEIYHLPKKGICAHRGANETHPENTIAAFEEAIRLGAQMIEFDVRMTKDNKLIIMHDRSVDRTTNGIGLVEELTWKKIKKLDAGQWKSEIFKGEKVPLFKDAIEVFPKNIWLNIHLKGDEELGKAVANVLLTKKRVHQGIIACNKEAAAGVKKAGPNIKICNMERQDERSTYVSETIKENFSTLQLLKKRNDDSLQNDIYELKKHHIRINYYFSNTADETIELFEMGVDFILTDRLSEMLEVAETIGIKRVVN